MRIDGFTTKDGVFNFEKFLLTKARDHHSRCHFLAHIADGTADKFARKVGEPLVVRPDVGEYAIFVGVIDSLNIVRAYAQTTIEVRAVSLSFAADTAKQFRIYQNPEKKLGEIVKYVGSKLEDKRTKCVLRGAEAQLANVVVQNQETDFAFLRRLADYTGQSLWVDDTSEGKAEIIIGTELSKEKKKITQDKIRKFQEQYSRTRERLIISTQEYLPLGVKVQLANKIDPLYLLTRFSLVHRRGVDEYTYELEKVENKAKTQAKLHRLEKSVKLLAEVTNTTDPENKERLQVRFIGQDKDTPIEDVDGEKRIWLPYRSPYCGQVGGIVFLPDKGDQVEVVYNNEECYVATAYRQKELAEECRKVEEKYIGNNKEQRIFWKNDSLVLCSFENKIIMDKDKIRLEVGKNAITITKKEIQFVNSGDGSWRSGGNCNIQATGAAYCKGSSVTIKADGEVAISGSTIKME